MFVKTFVTFFPGTAPFSARAGGSPPPSGGMVLTLVVVVIALAAALCASSTTSGIDRAMRLNWWFS
ncbi:MAG TPA: hypothetical protein VJS30_29250 [Paraburkholderia sp.]|nr:hypothetical protein [Paraburkholderia sp.]